ncbi:MAG: class I SAM-dependent methyltransferase [bacterium]
MPDWNEYYLDEGDVPRATEAEVYKFIELLESKFSERPLRIWDHLCGVGRHTVLIARMGHSSYGSDGAENAIKLTRKWLSRENLTAHLEVADMTVCPWDDAAFHGVISWDAIYHNTLDNIIRAMDVIYDHLISGGLFLGTFKSKKANSYGEGLEIEKDTFLTYEKNCREWGIPHHFFDEDGLRNLFKGWEILLMAEQIITYVEKRSDVLEHNIFSNTTWGVLARRNK